MRKNNIINLLEIQEKLVKKVERDQKIQHINIGKTASFLILKKRRYVCHNCNKKFYETYDFLQKYFRKSNEVYGNIIADFKCLKNYTTIANDNNVSIPTVVKYSKYHIFLSCKNILYHLPKRIGIDESRKYDDLEKYFSTFEKRNLVELVSMDLYSPFKRVIKDKFVNAKIVADRFHYTRLVMKSLDELRLNLWRNTKGLEKKYFKHLKLSLMKRSCNAKDYDVDKLLHAFEVSPILKAAYKLKKEFLNIKDLSTFEEKEKAFRKWLDNAECSTIKEFKSTVKTLRQWHEYISISFRYHISNGYVEGKNNLIKVLKRISFSFRNLDNLNIQKQRWLITISVPVLSNQF